MHNVNIDTVIAYKKNGVVHHFLEEYDARDGQTEDKGGAV
jgi:hypothetical protein